MKNIWIYAAMFLLPISIGATSITGTVKKASDSTVVGGAKVVLLQGATRLDSTTTDSLGQYTLLNVTNGTKQLQTSATGFVTATSNTTVDTTVAFDSVNVYLTAAVPGTITGNVRTSADSTAIAGAKVYLRRTSATSAIIDSAITDTAGLYTFSNLATGAPNYWVSVVATGYVSGASNNVAVGNGATVTRNFYLAVPGNLAGFVRNASDSATPLINALVVYRHSANGAIVDSIRTDSMGYYEFNNVAPGAPNYWITASADGFNSITSANQVVPSGGTLIVNFYMIATLPGSISGNVRDAADSTAIAGALVYLRRTSATSAIIDSAVTDAAGAYAFINLAPGTPNYWISASATGFQTGTNANQVVPNGGNLVSNFYLAATVPGTINGNVYKATDSTAIAGALVYLRRTSATSAIIDSAVTDGAGAYAFINLVPGTPNYYIAVTATGYVAGAGNNIAVGNGATVTRNFYLTAAVPGNITGTVRNAVDSTPLTGIRMYLRRSSATSAIIDSTTTDATGLYTFSNVAPGTPNYWVTASGNGIYTDSTAANVAVANGGTATRNFALTLIPVSVRSVSANNTHGFQFMRTGNRLLLNLDPSNTARMVRIYDMSGTLRNRISVIAGESHVEIPTAFAPSNGFLFQVK